MNVRSVRESCSSTCQQTSEGGIRKGLHSRSEKAEVSPASQVLPFRVLPARVAWLHMKSQQFLSFNFGNFRWFSPFDFTIGITLVKSLYIDILRLFDVSVD